ncbi:DDE-type integrase/transposase/recombinase [Streptomyces sp. MBT53]|uniref:DDE-type integrase/transposase/recombinase n=1 Tax=Streptomyces sp. MBT53 TaxID=1488384 RepID=UPI001913D39F|nr:DDE-type integrase/transposase/recombinase [Streptomyces sp. MBT53]MBK6016626.1 hypothetical protein [Streptomyces sp. MBT53]
MRELGITGAVRGERVITTLPGGQAERAPDLLDRDFVAADPNRCRVADFTYVKTWAGVVCVAFVVDTFSRRIVGWSAATVKETVFVVDAVMGWPRRCTKRVEAVRVINGDEWQAHFGRLRCRYRQTRPLTPTTGNRHCPAPQPPWLKICLLTQWSSRSRI